MGFYVIVYKTIKKNIIIKGDLKITEEIYNISQYKNEKGCLLNMDCVEGTKMLPDSSIDLTITSPPYDNLRKYKNGSSFDFENLAKQLFRITKEGGVVVWIVNDATKKMGMNP